MYLEQCNNCKYGDKCENRQSVEETSKGIAEYMEKQKEKYDLSVFSLSTSCRQYFSKEGSSYRSGPEGTFW